MHFFSLLLILTLDLYFLYRAHIEKDPVYLKGGLIVSWILVIVTIMIVWFFSSHINRGRSQFDVGMYHVAKMDESRMEQVKIRRFFWNLCLVIITMIVVSSMISYLFDAFFNVKFPVISIGKKNPWFRDLTCASIEGASGNTPGSITVDDDTNWCADKNYYIMALVLIIVTVLWFWLLISSLLFYLADKRSKVFTLFDKDKDNRKWIQYTGFWIYRNPYIKYPQSSYHSNNGFINFFMTPIYQLFWTNGVNRSTFPIYIELSPSDATLLSQYLMTHLSLYRSSDNEMSNQSNYNANSGGSSMNLNSNRR
jgi:magnesium-transporting ATPase (P-type)